MRQKRKLYVLSIDSMITEDIEFMKTLPTMNRILENAAIVSNVVTVYPSLTYTIHTSMMTGVYPDRHHIINNETFVPEVEHAPWYRSCHNFDSDVVTVLEAAKKAGYTTCAVHWPVTGDVDVDWHLPESWTAEGTPESMYQEFVRLGSKPEFLDEFWPEYGVHLNGLYDPAFTLLAHGATLAAIRNHQPDVIFEHLSLVDHARHSFGVYARPVYKYAYLEMELMLRETLNTMREVGVLDQTTIVITSDHGQTPVEKLIAPNTLLARDGLLRLNEDGSLKDWDMIFKSAAHSMQVYLKDGFPVEKAAEVLNKYAQEEDVGFERIRNAEETAAEMHVKGGFSFSIEGADGYSFSNALTGDLVRGTDNSNYKYSVATHGHDPRKGPKPAMILSGPGIIPGARVDGALIVDQAPTLAALLGVNLGNPDGHVMPGILE